jgi:hypothetical protein
LGFGFAILDRPKDPRFRLPDSPPTIQNLP